jgi:nucleoside-diphosphate-sugar epimerase
MPTSIVTGGAGFIGSHLCDKLLAEKHKVICIDDLSTGKMRNISHLMDNKNFFFIKADISKPLSPKQKKQKVDFIFHLASPASPIDYQSAPIKTLITNGIGTRNMLELAKANKARFLLASTSEVYGDPLQHPQRESDWGNVNPIGPRSCYDEGKRFAEALTKAYEREFDTDTRISRIFNTYGPRMRKDDGRVIPAFICQAVKNKPITVFGDGSQTRSFCYIDDMVEGIYLQMFSKKVKGEVINLGNPNEMSIIALANLIKETTGSDSKIVFKPLPVDDPTKRKPDISKAKKLLGWEPKVDFEEGIERTINYLSTIC